MVERETAPYLSLYSVDRAYRACRKRKRRTVRACLYEQRLLDHLVDTQDALKNAYWQPQPPVVFTVTKPKAREVYAACYEDRVVHHWLIPQLEAVIDQDFIHDAASNRKDRGTHFAVNRAQTFMRRIQGKGFVLQLDVASFFNSIHHDTLLERLSLKLQKAVKRKGMPLEQARQCYRMASRVIRQPCAAQAIRIGDARSFACVPEHKRLENAPPGTGLPIGNLTSQFFANLYLDVLDQFVKHDLKCSYYVRYVDDFLLMHKERSCLEDWHERIIFFLEEKLRLRLRPGSAPKALSSGVDFLGYIIRPDYRLVRRRVKGNLFEKLRDYEKKLLIPRGRGVQLELKPELRKSLRSVLVSYWGHFSHADAHGLKQAVFEKFPWLKNLFLDAFDLKPRWMPPTPLTMHSQWHWFKAMYPGCILIMQCGGSWLLNKPFLNAKPYAGPSPVKAWELPMKRGERLWKALDSAGLPWLVCTEEGFLKKGIRKRVLRRIVYLTLSLPPGGG
ncbi:reverse transcriptase (RNA-dependent DNA polymerase) [Desulfobotulus alkaliphilus]|uniref:Reverse transcriptase (RNA-dependent DNA polymerase) n=1 Tax=Desulfobotulus alkaliphilus TaxID=622671 RepID=A0A562RRH7_9BACT|nr:reverse transcriptase domain-containing protein [Desulfobotulus alkaliphilus]TWI71695.1 reverse transcriptase (RNA-dependent DNA polymerase) [Desulfobotulus alkaliphilus]